MEIIMGISDCFNPKWKSSNSLIRKKAIEKMDDSYAVSCLCDESLLIEIVSFAKNESVRLAAVENALFADKKLLLNIIKNDPNENVREAAEIKIADQKVALVQKPILTDQKSLSEEAQNDKYELKEKEKKLANTYQTTGCLGTAVVIGVTWYISAMQKRPLWLLLGVFVISPILFLIFIIPAIRYRIKYKNQIKEEREYLKRIRTQKPTKLSSDWKFSATCHYCGYRIYATDYVSKEQGGDCDGCEIIKCPKCLQRNLVTEWRHF